MQPEGEIAKPKMAEPRYRYHKGDYQTVNDNLSAVNWDVELIALTAEQAWNYFLLTLREQMKLHIPMSVPNNDKLGKIRMTRELSHNN